MRTGILISILLYAFQAAAQISSMPFNKVELRVDTLIFDTNKNLVTVNKEQKLYFKYSSEEQDCQVRLYSADFSKMRNLKLMPSADFELLDSLAGFEREYIQFTVRFLNLSSSDFLNFIFTYLPIGKDTVSTVKIPLLPYTNTGLPCIPTMINYSSGKKKPMSLPRTTPRMSGSAASGRPTSPSTTG